MADLSIGKNKSSTTVYALLICFFLVVASAAVYWQAGGYGFVLFNDNTYITENSHITSGFSVNSIIWSFTPSPDRPWQPLVWLSYMLDYTISGLNPGWFHLTNLLFHIINTLLLFIALRSMTGALWQSGFVAALFALHPLQVEPVAWIGERKNLIATFFWMLTILSYLWYLRRPGIWRYLQLLFCFILGLMSSTMLAALPLVLLLLDYWPLKRIASKKPPDDGEATKDASGLSSVILEKAPLFIAAAAIFFIARTTGALGSFETVPLQSRIANALVSTMLYMGKIVWPCNLAVLYPHPGNTLELWQPTAACVCIISISTLAISTVRSSPWFLCGWLWFLVTLIPGLGFVQTGLYAMADRFTYIPLIGIGISIAWGFTACMAQRRCGKSLLSLLALAGIAGLSITAGQQLQYWENSDKLFERALSVTDGNYVIHTMLGRLLLTMGDTRGADWQVREALRLKSDYAEAHNTLGLVLMRQGKTDEAIAHYISSVTLKPDFAETYNNLGMAYYANGDLDSAVMSLREAVRKKPDYEDAHYNLGRVLEKHGKPEDAIKHYTAVLRINPHDVHAYTSLGMALYSRGYVQEAVKYLNEAIQRKPDYADAHFNLGLVMAKQGKTDEAIGQFQKTLRINPEHAQAHYMLGIVRLEQGRTIDAWTHFYRAVQTKPDYAEAHLNLGVVLGLQGKADEAADHFKEALRIKPDYAQAHYNLGAVFLAKGDMRQADDHLQRALRIKPELAEKYNELKKTFKTRHEIKYLSR